MRLRSGWPKRGRTSARRRTTRASTACCAAWSGGGLLTSRLTESESGPARREYALTARGRLFLEHWAAALARYRETIDAVLTFCRN